MAEKEKRLLIVDDSELDRTILRTILEDDFEVFETTNGYMAFEMLAREREKIDAVMLDISMPVISGFDLLLLLKENKMDDVPVFLMTSETTPDNVRRAREFKIAEFIGKPFDRDEILKRLRSWLGMATDYVLAPEDVIATKKYIAELESLEL